ncbi:TonB-dependent receptor [Flavobacterium akiainvivens]|uniref:TonB-dependent receptor n=1 Tax=Flavobacterium akiainvivens TaxID=1202724 RepID=A0A0M9VJD1_9FLAO|nr:TonB-dependent receptor [Flavobacterium akiainvivens]KOS07640.1 TonB-dependent receptor [Flavobacterium akiainvivens]SFQ23299.1 outer membrane receptor for ferrienterochelin and colicins [Flavobacterium akiainvivens]
MFKKYILILFGFTALHAQTAKINGRVTDGKTGILAATVLIEGLNLLAVADENGNYIIENIPAGSYEVIAASVGYSTLRQKFTILDGETQTLDFKLQQDDESLDEVVITGTMKEVSRMDSPIPVEIITPKLFKKNPTASLFEAVGMINGVQPQLNCNVCNTGDIHINGMEGPYTMILIDGMPIVSALSTVYGLSGIPNSIVERIEVVKGPASSLYGSEAMGGIINVITKAPYKAPLVSADYFFTSWGEHSLDAAVKINAGKAKSLLGINYFNYQVKADKNHDNFTDVTQQNRISIFNKWDFEREENRQASIAGRYVYEDRWGGEMDWTPAFRGSDSIYGESIYTQRAEVIGLYQLPTAERIFTQFSYNWHNQDSYYGTTPYMATQQVAFVQAYWDKQFGDNHTFLLGAAFRYTHYDDNTPGTANENGVNRPQETPLPGVFIQDEWTLNERHKLLGGYRFDYDKNHGGVHSPRVAYKFSPNQHNTLRASFGTGFRVVNLFTEDHAALTGSRDVVIAEELKPERSLNGNLNYVLKIPTDAFVLGLDATAFYSYFTNKIVGDFDTDPTKIIYDNLNGHAISQGLSLNTDLTFNFPLKVMAGISYMDVFQMEENENGSLQRTQQLHAPKWSGNYVATYSFPNNYSIDLTGNWYGPMRLPILPNDYRPEYSPWFLTANIQATKKFDNGLEFYGGVKNIFDFVPGDPLMRPFDPFDQHVNDPVNNPNGYTFDTTYNYASMQGRRVFLGVRYNLF